MPRGQKSKGRSRARRQQAQAQAQIEGQDLQSAVLPAEVEADSPPICQGADEGSSSSSQIVTFILPKFRDSLTRKASMLLHFLLDRYEKKESILHADMLKVVSRKYKTHFPDILRRASEQLELVYGLELKPVDSSSLSYSLVNKLGFSIGENINCRKELPKMGLLMTLLGVIFMKGNRATEEEVWEFLSVLGIHSGQRHIIFGEPKKLISKDLVLQNYLEYRQVPGSDPPCYEFLWGPRAHAETTKMKVLEVLAKINGTTPSAFPSLYEEALSDQLERAGRRDSARAHTVAKAGAHTK